MDRIDDVEARQTSRQHQPLPVALDVYRIESMVKVRMSLHELASKRHKFLWAQRGNLEALWLSSFLGRGEFRLEHCPSPGSRDRGRQKRRGGYTQSVYRVAAYESAHRLPLALLADCSSIDTALLRDATLYEEIRKWPQ